MSDSFQKPLSENTYIIDSSSAAELVRLINLDKLITQSMGGWFPEDFELAHTRYVLDVACGPGGWVLELAFAHPDIDIVGFDLNHTVIQYARAQAKVQNLENAHFEVMDATKILRFPADSFDFVNARFLVSFLSKSAWPGRLRELMRVTRPGGTIRLTETDAVLFTNSPAVTKLDAYFARACYLTGRSFAPEGNHFGITPMLRHFLRDAGCENIQEQPYVLNFSTGEKIYWNYYEIMRVALKLREPFVIRTGVATQEELDILYRQMLSEVLSDNFCGLFYYLSVWGKKPMSIAPEESELDEEDTDEYN